MTSEMVPTIRNIRRSAGRTTIVGPMVHKTIIVLISRYSYYMYIHFITIYALSLLACVVLTLVTLLGTIRHGRLVGLTAVITFAVTLAVAFTEGWTGRDYAVFWTAGRAMWRGANPYDPSGFGKMPFMNPPTFLPIAATMALPNQKTSEAIWMVLNFLGSLLLVPLALKIVESDQDWQGSTDPETAAVLTATVVLSIGSFSNMRLGQLSILTALAILYGLRLRDQGYPVLSGVCLAFATFKIATLIPFLLLLTLTRRKSDLVVWGSLVIMVLILSLTAVPTHLLADRLHDNLRNILHYCEEGEINDYTVKTDSHFGIIGIDRALYCLGLRDRAAIRIAQYSMLGVMMAGLAVIIHRRRSVSSSCAYSLVSCCSMIFLYHRVYDTVILALPLCYTIHRARFGAGCTRRFSAMAALCLLGAMQASGDIRIYNWINSMGPWSRLLQALVLPASTWLIVASMLFIVMDARLKSKLPTSHPQRA